jgi:hypothetical protein
MAGRRQGIRIAVPALTGRDALSAGAQKKGIPVNL